MSKEAKRIQFSKENYYEQDTTDSKNTRNNLLMKPLCTFYKKDDNFKKLCRIILKQETKLSLRLIDWFMITYIGNNSHNDNYLLKLWKKYKSILKSFSKKSFDPFGRTDPKGRGRIKIKDCETDEIVLVSTIGQLNCFKWMIEDNIIEYIEENYDEISDQMIEDSKTKKKGKKKEKKKEKKTKSTKVSVKKRDTTIKGHMTIDENITIRISFQ